MKSRQIAAGAPPDLRTTQEVGVGLAQEATSGGASSPGPAARKATSAELADEEIGKLLGRLDVLWSPTLNDTLFTIAKEQVLAEERRQTLLMGKANALLGAAGLSATVAFTFGGLLMQRGATGWPLLLYVVALFLGVGATICATVAMRVRESEAISPTVVFNAEALQSADGADVDLSQGGSQKATDAEVQASSDKDMPSPPEVKATGVAGTTAYKRFITGHLWQIYTFNSVRHGETAAWIWRGQILYGMFLTAILAAGLFLASSVHATSAGIVQGAQGLQPTLGVNSMSGASRNPGAQPIDRKAAPQNTSPDPGALPGALPVSGAGVGGQRDGGLVTIADGGP